MNVTKVFVYGTLKTGERNHPVALRAGQPVVTPGTLWDHQLWDLGPFPAAVKGDGFIVGEVLDFGNEVSRALFGLDGLEGFRGSGNPHNLYNRAVLPVVVTGPDGEPVPVPCWVYLYNRQLGSARRLHTGRWHGKLDKVVS